MGYQAMKGSVVHIVELKMSSTGDSNDFDGHDYNDFYLDFNNPPKMHQLVRVTSRRF